MRHLFLRDILDIPMTTCYNRYDGIHAEYGDNFLSAPVILGTMLSGAICPW